MPLLAVALFLSPPASAQPPLEELYVQAPARRLMDAALGVVEADPVAALVTIDADGRPRVRSVEVHVELHRDQTSEVRGEEVESASAAQSQTEKLDLWIATRPGTRKLQQIEANREVALYFEDDDSGSYLSVMGRAVLVREPEAVRRESWHSAEQLAEFYPNFPQDMVLIRVRAVWLEVIAPGVEASVDLWRPQAVVLPAARPEPR